MTSAHLLVVLSGSADPADPEPLLQSASVAGGTSVRPYPGQPAPGADLRLRDRALWHPDPAGHLGRHRGDAERALAEFTREVNRLLIERGADLADWKSELENVDRELDKMVEAILQSFPPAKLKGKAEKLEARKAELSGLLENADEPPPLLHPNIAQMYQDRIARSRPA